MEPLLLLILALKVSSQTNLFCNSEISWLKRYPSNNPFTIDNTECEAQYIKGSASSSYDAPEITLDVSNIFSSSSNYPIEFSLIADAFGGEAEIGIIFYSYTNIDKWNWYYLNTNGISSLKLTWNGYSSSQYQYQWSHDTDSDSGISTAQFQARYIERVGIYVMRTTLEQSSDSVDFTWASLTGLTQSPTPNPTNNPSKRPSESPTESPSETPSKSITIEPSKSPSTLEPTMIPSMMPTSMEPSQSPLTLSPSDMPTMTPSISPTNKPSNRPTVDYESSLQCDDNYAITQISFSYTVGDIEDNDKIDGYLRNVTDTLVETKNESLTDCYISKYIKKIETDVDIDIERVIINISMCTTCEQDEIENDLVNEFEDLIDKDTTIIAIMPDTITIEIDIINERDGEAITKSSTISPIIHKPDQQNEGTENNTIWIIISILLVIICLCAMVIIILRIRKNKSNINIKHGMDIMRVMSSSVLEAKQNGEEDMTGSNDAPKGTHSSHNEIDQVIIGDDDQEAESPNTGTTSGQITSSDDLNNQNKNDNDDQKYVENIDINDNEDIIKVQRWLTENVRFPQYFDNFVQNGYESLDLIKEIPDKNELKQIGIDLAGHRTKVMAEIRKLKNDNDYLPHVANFAMTFEGD